MATAFAPKVSQILMTPDPHYIPGYSGHCPHYKFSLGQTYAKLTSQLLTSPEVPSTGRRQLLQPTCFPCEGAEQPEPEERGCTVIPGYTGFIPRAQNHFAKTYCEVCKEARREFARQLAMGTAGRKQTWHLAEGGFPKDIKPESRLLTAKYNTPLKALSQAAAPRVPAPSAFKTEGSPYSMENSNPRKYFMSGFTGFVPRARYLIGASYPVLTHRALVQFGQTLQKQGRMSLENSPETQKEEEALPPLAKTYPTDRGLLPHYKGYVPGYKFQFGHTYGHLTYNALGHSTLEKQTLDVVP